MSNVNWVARRADHACGHVAMAVVPYVPRDTPIAAATRLRLQPWTCTFHCNDGGPRAFVAFGGRDGMEQAVQHYLGERLPRAGAHHG